MKEESVEKVKLIINASFSKLIEESVMIPKESNLIVFKLSAVKKLTIIESKVGFEYSIKI